MEYLQHYCNIQATQGFDQKLLQYPTWERIYDINMPQPICNLYRKISMSIIGRYRLYITNMKTNDPFILTNLIETRIQQICINQEHLTDEYEINVTNNIQQEMLVSSDHIRWQGKSAIIERQLCDKIPIFKLGIGKHIQIQLKKQTLAPFIDDKYRGVNISFIRKDINPINNYQMTHDKIVTQLYFQSSGNVKDISSFNSQVIQVINDIIAKETPAIQTYFLKQSQIFRVSFNNLPTYMVDIIQCYIHKEILKNFQHLKADQDKNNQHILIIIPKEIVQNPAQISEKITQIVKKAFKDIGHDLEYLCKQINDN